MLTQLLACSLVIDPLVSVLQSLSGGLPPQLLVDVGLWTAQLVNAGVVINYLSGGHTAVGRQILYYLWFFLPLRKKF